MRRIGPLHLCPSLCRQQPRILVYGEEPAVRDGDLADAMGQGVGQCGEWVGVGGIGIIGIIIGVVVGVGIGSESGFVHVFTTGWEFG